ncbi:MAG: EAL domain-containing protein [Cyanobacteria bacterium P01_B01_bin.77]
MLDQPSLIVDVSTPLSTLLTWMSHNNSGVFVSSESSVTEARANPRVGYALVTEHQKLVGIFTARDFVKLIAQGADITVLCVADVMTSPLITLTEAELDDPLAVLGLLRKYRIRHLPVLREGNLLGVVTSQSLRKAVQPKVLLKLRPVADVMVPEVITALPETTLIELAQLMVASHVSCVVIVEADVSGGLPNSAKRPLGIVTERDIVQFRALLLDVNTVTARRIMSTPLVLVQPETSLWDASQVMQRLRVQRLVVADRFGYLVGIVTQTSFLSILNPIEMASTVEILQQQVEQLKDERLHLLGQLNRRLAQQVEESEQRFQLTFEQAAAGIANVDLQGRFLQVNRRFCEMLGYSETQLMSKTGFDITHPAHINETKGGVERLIRAEIDVFTYDKRCLRSDGTEIWLHVTISQVHTPEDNYLVIVAEDISERKQLEQELEEHRSHLRDLVASKTTELQLEIVQRQAAEYELFQEKELAQVTLQSIGDAVVTTDDTGRITYLNPVAEKLTGWTNAEAIGRPLTSVFVIVRAGTRDPLENPVERVLREGSISALEQDSILLARDGAEYGIDDSAAPLRDRNGQMLGSVMVFRDVTQSRKIAQQLSWQASHDSLTGLANRRKFEAILKATLENSLGHHHVLCYLDLDRFKLVNDTCGHNAGDDLLQQVALLIKQQVRGVDTLARLGGDEFGLILHGCRLPEAAVIAEKIRVAIHELRFTWNDVIFRIGVSIGLAKIDADTPNIEAVLSAADAACHQAKTRGRNRVRVYQADDSGIVQQRGQQQWSMRIKQALEQDRFCFYQQPIVSTKTGNSTHSEILLRMIDDAGHLISPSQFIPAAERYDLMVSIDRWVITHFFEYLANQHILSPEITYMINLSGVSLGDDAFRIFLIEQLANFHLSSQCICFEITETAAVRNLSQAAEFMHHLKKLGFSFALDDFGSGMSSFAYLKTLPVDYVKVDGKFITDMALDEAAIAIVEAIHNVAQVMGLQTIAEFVETKELSGLIQKVDIDLMQGYYIAEPSPLIDA